MPRRSPRAIKEWCNCLRSGWRPTTPRRIRKQALQESQASMHPIYERWLLCFLRGRYRSVPPTVASSWSSTGCRTDAKNGSDLSLVVLYHASILAWLLLVFTGDRRWRKAKSFSSFHVHYYYVCLASRPPATGHLLMQLSCWAVVVLFLVLTGGVLCKHRKRMTMDMVRRAIAEC